jgi:dTDP-4-dehydrorhamnose 3,5-epimerase
MDGVLVTALKRIPTPKGDVFWGMKCSDQGYAGFGEAYFSSVDSGAVKGWKRHNRMTLNFVVPCGEVQVSVVNQATADRLSLRLGPRDATTYCRLTIAPGLWVAFGGLAASLNLILNLASLPHDPTEAENVPIDTFPWSWEQRM